MYVHLGRDYVLNDRDIIGIFNLETTTQSYVLADSPVDTIYLSELSPAALKRRTEMKLE